MGRSPRSLVLSGLALLGWIEPAAASAEPVRVGSEFQVNVQTQLDQADPAVAVDPAGSFVVVWQTYHEYPYRVSLGVGAQVFDSSAGRLGSELRVNEPSDTSRRRFSPEVVVASSGNFVVVWESEYQDASGWGAFGRRFDGTGAPLASEFQINSSTEGDQRDPSVSGDASGSFVVVWEGYSYEDGRSSGIFARSFDSLGVPHGDEFHVNTFGYGDQRRPAVAMDGGGNFLVVWETYEGYGTGIAGQLFDGEGRVRGSEFRVNTYTAGDQRYPAVAAGSEGDFVVVWESGEYGYTYEDASSDSSGSQDGSGSGIFGRRFDGGGAPLGGEFAVNATTLGVQERPDVAVDGRGDFVVVWQTRGQPYGAPDAFGVFGRQFDATARPRGSEFQVNTFTPFLQVEPSVAADASGHFVVVWQSGFQDGSGGGIFGQRFAAEPGVGWLRLIALAGITLAASVARRLEGRA